MPDETLPDQPDQIARLDQADSEPFANLAPEQILDAVESAGYRCNGNFLALNSYENRVYRVDLANETVDQPVERLVVKFYRPRRWSDGAIIEEHLFTQQLAAAELPVIAPLAGPQAQTLFAHAGHRFALYPCRGGRAPQLDNSDHLEQLGRLVGRIHAIGASDRFAERIEYSVANMGDQPREYLLHSDQVPDYLRDNYAAVTAELLAGVRDSFDAAGGVQSIRLHGDLHAGNVLWTDAGPHLVDFDDACTGPAIQDLWMFLSGDRAYMTACLADLLAGYCQFNDFNPRELHLVEALRSLRIIHHVAWIARRWSDPAFPRAFPAFAETRFWEEHLNTLREQIDRLHEPVLVWD